MAHFGSKKDANTWFNFRKTKEEPKETLAKKLEKEQIKRRAAEKEVARLKKEVRTLKEIAMEYIKDDGVKLIT